MDYIFYKRLLSNLVTRRTLCQVTLHCLITSGHTQAMPVESLTLLFELTAWPGNTVANDCLQSVFDVLFLYLVIKLSLILCHDSDSGPFFFVTSCQMFIQFCRGTHQGEEGDSVDLLSCMRTILTNDYKINRVFHSDDRVDCCTLPSAPNY